jgi:hypothetical protein
VLGFFKKNGKSKNRKPLKNKSGTLKVMSQENVSDKKISKNVKNQTLDILSSLIRPEDDSGKEQHARLRQVWGCANMTQDDGASKKTTVEVTPRQPGKPRVEKGYTTSASAKVLMGPVSDAVQEELIRLRRLKEELNISFNTTTPQELKETLKAAAMAEDKLKMKVTRKLEFGSQLKDKGLMFNGPERLGHINGKYRMSHMTTTGTVNKETISNPNHPSATLVHTSTNQLSSSSSTVASTSKIFDKLYNDASMRNNLKVKQQEQEAQVETSSSSSTKKIPKKQSKEVVDRLYNDAVTRHNNNKPIPSSSQHNNEASSNVTERGNNPSGSDHFNSMNKGISFSKASRTAPVAYFRTPGDVIDDANNFGREIHATSKRYQGGGLDGGCGGAVYPSSQKSAWWVDETANDAIVQKKLNMKRTQAFLAAVKVSQALMRFTYLLAALKKKKEILQEGDVARQESLETVRPRW